MSDRPDPVGFNINMSTTVEKDELFAAIEIANRMVLGLSLEGYEVNIRVTPVLDFFAGDDEDEEEANENPSEGEE